MSKPITREDVAKLAHLARLQLSETELDAYVAELQAILGYIDMLQSADTSGLKPTSQVTGLTNVMRPDTVKETGPKPEQLLAGVPERENDYIKVRRMI